MLPGLTDTFGRVLLEAMASGVPVAAYPVGGPVAVVAPGTGALNNVLTAAIEVALELDRADCRAYAETRCRDAAAAEFMHPLAPADAALAHSHILGDGLDWQRGNPRSRG